MGPCSYRDTETNRLLTLLDGRPTVADGGYGWLLQERGLAMGDRAESWNLTSPDAGAALHGGYAGAGAGILTTNTFGATEPRLAAHRLSGRTGEVNRAWQRAVPTSSWSRR